MTKKGAEDDDFDILVTPDGYSDLELTVDDLVNLEHLESLDGAFTNAILDGSSNDGYDLILVPKSKES